MSKLEKAKEIIMENYNDAYCGIFDCRNTAGDRMTTVYEDEELQVDICYDWNYFEVFGLTDEEFTELETFYGQIRRGEV